jgi:hypothetical protein
MVQHVNEAIERTHRLTGPPKADIALAHWDFCLVKVDVRLPCGLYNHTAVGLFPSVAGPSPRVIASADVAGHVARAAPLVIGGERRART